MSWTTSGYSLRTCRKVNSARTRRTSSVHCAYENRRTSLYSFLYKCEECDREPKSYVCADCGSTTALDRDKLLGYAGRVTDDATITDENPKYRFPSRRERGGTIYETRKSLFLYNGFRIKSPCNDLIVVEGFASVWWLTQNGLTSCVALTGADCSDEQIEEIVVKVKQDGRVWLMPDGDKAGRTLASVMLPKIGQHRFVRWVKLPDGIRPTGLDRDAIRALIG